MGLTNRSEEGHHSSLTTPKCLLKISTHPTSQRRYRFTGRLGAPPFPFCVDPVKFAAAFSDLHAEECSAMIVRFSHSLRIREEYADSTTHRAGHRRREMHFSGGSYVHLQMRTSIPLRKQNEETADSGRFCELDCSENWPRFLFNWYPGAEEEAIWREGNPEHTSKGRSWHM